MKILYHHRTLGDGGEGVHIREMVEALRMLGHDVRVVSLIGEATNIATSERRRWTRLSRLIPSSIYELAELGYNIVGSRKLMRAIREFHPDFIYDRYNSYNVAALRAARRARLPILLEVNAPVAYERMAYEHLKLKFPWLAQRYERAICASVDHIFTVSTPLKSYLVQERGVPAEKISVLPNGANPEAFHPALDGASVRRRYRIEDRTIIGFVGILRPWHGVDMLIDVFARLRREYPSLHLLIVGDGPIQNQLEAQIERQRIGSAVTFTGRLQNTEVRHHVAAMDITISSHATFYASPLKILEYMSMAKPVVAPDMDNIRDIICHGQDGFLFEPESAESLYHQINSLLKAPQQRASIGKAARQKIETQLNWQQNARQVIDTYQQITSKKTCTATAIA